MGFSASDVVPFTQTRANLSELADIAAGRAARLPAGDCLMLYAAHVSSIWERTHP